MKNPEFGTRLAVPYTCRRMRCFQAACKRGDIDDAEGDAGSRRRWFRVSLPDSWRQGRDAYRQATAARSLVWSHGNEFVPLKHRWLSILRSS